jgi:hypothetical protein
MSRLFNNELFIIAQKEYEYDLIVALRQIPLTFNIMLCVKKYNDRDSHHHRLESYPLGIFGTSGAWPYVSGNPASCNISVKPVVGRLLSPALADRMRFVTVVYSPPPVPS